MTEPRVDGFRWSRNADGTYTMYDVPIFYECEREGEVYDDAWIRAAYDQLFEAEITKGHRPPVTFGHRRAANPEPPGAGWFAARRVGEFAGKSALFVNMTLNESGFEAIRSKRVPYRSVEAMRPSVEPEDAELLIESLSLLDNAPYLALPMTFLGDEVPEGESSDGGTPVPPVTVTFSRSRSRLSPVVAFAAVGRRCLVLCEAPMSDDESKDEVIPAAAPEDAAEPAAESESSEKSSDDGVGKAVSLLRELMATPVPLQDARIVASMLREKLTELESGMDDDGDGDDVGRSEPSDDPSMPDMSQEPPRDGKEPMNMSASTKEAAEVFAKNRLLDQRLTKLETEREQDAAVRETCKRLENVAFASDPEAECRSVIERFPTTWRESLKFAADVWEKSAPRVRKASAHYADDMASLPEDVVALGLTNPTELEAAMKAHAAFGAMPEPLRKCGFAAYFGANARRFLPMATA